MFEDLYWEKYKTKILDYTKVLKNDLQLPNCLQNFFIIQQGHETAASKFI